MTDKSAEKPPRLDDPDERLRWLRKRAGFDDATAAARRYNWNENTYRSHENGSRQISRKAAAKYAKPYKTTAAWILYGEGALTSPVDPEIATLWDNLAPEQQSVVRELMRQMIRRVA